MISKFSDKLLSNQQLKTVKGGSTPYCFCYGSPVNCPPGETGGSPLPPNSPGCP
ncbi:natural product precursor [Saonia flava]|uniref:Natural product n=1 Tax=Saonia flava TaxID=523696 RepID=A0A846QTN9_9FLAO|nr:hypothetical protein [Saonia flava]NJB70330.1 natural product precursor [Saonia flava]